MIGSAAAGAGEAGQVEVGQAPCSWRLGDSAGIGAGPSNGFDFPSFLKRQQPGTHKIAQTANNKTERAALRFDSEIIAKPDKKMGPAGDKDESVPFTLLIIMGFYQRKNTFLEIFFRINPN